MNQPSEILESLHVLIVEDAEDIRHLFSRLLNRYGAKVTTAKDGEDAVEKMEGETFDLTLMDLEMPNMDGMEAVIQLRRGGYQGKIVALSGHSWDSLPESLVAAGFNGYLMKPIALDELVDKILYFCGRKPSKEVAAQLTFY